MAVTIAPKRIHRSPPYPTIDLESAIERARKFYEFEKRSAANVLVAVRHWNYSPQSSGGRQVLATLIAFGLMTDKGSGDLREVKLSELALKIILDERPGSLDKIDALRKAALTPKLYNDIYQKWPDEFPSDPTLKHYLLVEKRFNDNSTADFIKGFRDTFTFAGIYEADKVEQDDSSEEEIVVQPIGISNEYTSPEIRLPVAQGSQVAPVVQPGMRQDTFSLDEGIVVLQWPSQLSEDSYEDLKDWLELQLRRIGRAVQSS